VELFHTPPRLDALALGDSIWISRWTENEDDETIRRWRPRGIRWINFVTILVRDKRTDGRADGLVYGYKAPHSISYM